MRMQKTTEDVDWEFCDYALDLEKEWRESLPRFTDKELLQIFPEVKKVIPEKIDEYEADNERDRKALKSNLGLIQGRTSADSFARWFYEHCVAWLLPEARTIVWRTKQIDRLRWTLKLANPKNKNALAWREKKERAKRRSIEEVAIPILEQNGRVRRLGSRIQARCIFHSDKNPSLVLYPESNTFCCFGCGVTGDQITFIQKAQNVDFKQAVEILAT